MNLRPLLIACMLGVATSALANNSPDLMAEFDDLVACGVDVDAETLNEAKARREERGTLHAAGSHDQSVEALQLALDLLQSD